LGFFDRGAGEGVCGVFGAEGRGYVAADEVGAFGGEGEGCGAAYAGGRAGDYGGFVGEAAGHGGIRDLDEFWSGEFGMGLKFFWGGNIGLMGYWIAGDVVVVKIAAGVGLAWTANRVRFSEICLAVQMWSGRRIEEQEKDST
jgi:hypothetical protein